MVWGIMTVMAMTLQQLRDASDEDLIKAHDDIAHALNPSVSYYLDELGRRDTERAIRADQKLAKYILYLTVANGLLAVVSICVALAAFLASDGAHARTTLGVKRPRGPSSLVTRSCNACGATQVGQSCAIVLF